MAKSKQVLGAVHLADDELPRGPWTYGRQVQRAEAEDGDLVEIFDRSGRFVGHGLYNAASDVRVRWLARGKKSALDRPEVFLAGVLRAADRLRRRVLRLDEVSNAYRIAHAEGDDLPGLVVDRLRDVLVCEHHSLGFFRLRESIARGLTELYPDARVVHRVPRAARRAEDFEPTSEPEDLGKVWIQEHGLRFPVLPGRGHKTGWFCDQRDNRRAIGALGEGRYVLDICCNAGGFALAAARAGARRVVAADLDEKCLELAEEAGAANELEVDWRHADGFDVLRSVEREPPQERPELVILDPPKIIAGRAALEEGRRKYYDWNRLALSAVRPGGLVASFSCSGALDLPGFLGTVFAAARGAGVRVKLLDVLGPGPDHPQRPDWSRSRYLKGALLAVDRS